MTLLQSDFDWNLATSTERDSESQSTKVLINQDFTILVNQILMSFRGWIPRPGSSRYSTPTPLAGNHLKELRAGETLIKHGALATNPQSFASLP